jgi:hypothetical protein
MAPLQTFLAKYMLFQLRPTEKSCKKELCRVCDGFSRDFGCQTPVTSNQDFWRTWEFGESYCNCSTLVETHLTMMLPNEDVDGAVQVTVIDDLGRLML